MWWVGNRGTTELQPRAAHGCARPHPATRKAGGGLTMLHRWFVTIVAFALALGLGSAVNINVNSNRPVLGAIVGVLGEGVAAAQVPTNYRFFNGTGVNGQLGQPYTQGAQSALKVRIEKVWPTIAKRHQNALEYYGVMANTNWFRNNSGPQGEYWFVAGIFRQLTKIPLDDRNKTNEALVGKISSDPDYVDSLMIMNKTGALISGGYVGEVHVYFGDVKGGCTPNALAYYFSPPDISGMKVVGVVLCGDDGVRVANLPTDFGGFDTTLESIFVHEFAHAVDDVHKATTGNELNISDIMEMDRSCIRVYGLKGILALVGNSAYDPLTYLDLRTIADWYPIWVSVINYNYDASKQILVGMNVAGGSCGGVQDDVGTCKNGQTPVAACGGLPIGDAGTPTDGGIAPLDLGGSFRTPCTSDSQCASKVCQDGLCRSPYCGNGVLNRVGVGGGSGESDIDCGGEECGRCADGKKCFAATDCKSGVCTGGKCAGGGDVQGGCDVGTGRGDRNWGAIVLLLAVLLIFSSAIAAWRQFERKQGRRT